MECSMDCEFNAPQYIDFLNDDESEDLDNWFDENPGHEGGVRISQIGPYFEHHSNFKQATRAITAALEEAIVEENKPFNNEVVVKVEEDHQVKNRRDTFTAEPPMVVEAVDMVPVEQNADSDTDSSVGLGKQSKVITVPKNLLTSWEGKSNNTPKNNVNNVNKHGSGKGAFRKVRRNTELQRKSPMVKKDVKKSGNKTQKYVGTPDMKRKSCSSASPAVQKTGRLSDKKPKMNVKKPLLMMPRTPTFMRRILNNRFGRAKQTTEDLELEKINEMRKEMKGHLKKNTTYVKKALSSNSYMPTRSATEITKPVEFHFATDSRIKQHPMNLRMDNTEKDFQEQLRKHPPSPTLKQRSTKVVPFSFQSDARMNKAVGGEQSAKKWESMASAVNNFYCRTPERCRSKQGSEQIDGPRCQNVKPLKLTHPKTPQFVSQNRFRPVTAPSQEQLEEKQVEEMKNYTFKAKEFDRRIIDADGMYGVKVQQRAPSTEAKPFNFESSGRFERKQRDGLPPEEEKSIKGHITTTNKGSSSINKASASSSRPPQPRLRSTDIKPFSFEERDKQAIARKEHKIKEIICEEEKAREFYARPLPNFSPDLPEIEKKPTTDPQPFNLSNDTKGERMLEKWHEKIKIEQQEQDENRKFKAQPANVIYEQAFKPKPSVRPLTDVSAFKLNTEERSKEREEYESRKKEQERITEEELQERLMNEEEEEKLNVIVLRSQMVHQANPIRTYKTVEFTGSDKPVTVPVTPNFETTKRLGRSMRV